MSIQKIIQEAVSKNPVGLKEVLEEELAKRVAEAIEAKLEESSDENKLKKNIYTAKIGHDADISQLNYKKGELKHLQSRTRNDENSQEGRRNR